MDVGMLWRDEAEGRTLDEKVARAADYYRRKYGAAPTVCVVNPRMLPPDADVAGGLRLVGARTVQVNHFWLGVNDAPTARPDPAREGTTP